MEEPRDIFFDELAHKYTDKLGNEYISATTILGKYENKFEEEAANIAKACENIGRNPDHPKYLKYKGKSARQILDDWDKLRDTGCEKGNRKHNYLEQAIKGANGYKRNTNGFINDRLYTVSTIFKYHRYGHLNLDYFIKAGVRDKYPKIYEIIEDHVKDGFNIYAEIGTYWSPFLISGLIDVFPLKPKTKEFRIIDWKSAIDSFNYKSGYFIKDNEGRRTDKWINTNSYLKFPLDKYEASSGHKASLQLSMYAYLTEQWGYKLIPTDSFILAHIKNVLRNGIETDEEIVEFPEVKDMRKDIKVLIEHYLSNNKVKGKVNYKLNI